jgi:hypothetical protein
MTTTVASILLGPVQKDESCTNCFEVHTDFPETCVLHALLATMLEFGDITQERAEELSVLVNPDLLWDDLHVILSKIRTGHYDYDA